jgi:hypothetical protein
VDDTNIDDSKFRVLEQHQGSVDNLKNVVMDDTNINTGDDLKLGLLEQHQDSVDNLKSVEEKTIREEISAVSENIKRVVETGHGEDARGATGTSKDEFDSSINVALDNSSAGLLDENDPNVSAVNHEGLFKEDDTPALEDGPGNQRLASHNPGHQGKKPAPSDVSSSNVVSTTVDDTPNTSMDKLDCSGGVASNDSPAGILEGSDLRVSSINDAESIKEAANSASEVGGHDVTSHVPEPWGNKSAISVNSNNNAVCSSGTDPVAEKTQCKEQVTSLGS